MAPPITYALGGEQYVAVLAGLGGAAGLHFTRLEYENAGRLVAWKLGGDSSMPAAVRRKPGRVDAPAVSFAPEEVTRGRDLYSRHCMQCHGVGVKSSGVLPDLRFASREVHEDWASIVVGGSLASQGMASFADVLSVDDAAAIHAYVIERAHATDGWLEGLLRWAGRHACVPIAWVVD